MVPGQLSLVEISDLLDYIAPQETELSVRAQLLVDASALVDGARDQAYGTPHDNMGRIAQLWSVIFGREVTEAQVSLAMIAVKIARLVNDDSKVDSWTDIAGYAAVGCEVATT